MRDLVKAYDGLPFLIKLILALPGIDGIAYGIYRIAKGIDRKDNVMLLAGIIWLFLGIVILWVIDLVSVLMYGSVKFLA
ncbi:MAG: hypothetical protein RBT45_03515 [Acholeplasmataceae bacterium]|jgi:hypothetical protein|nr:hypothetical protein [Acholeplasmataceae bacterium]